MSSIREAAEQKIADALGEDTEADTQEEDIDSGLPETEAETEVAAPEKGTPEGTDEEANAAATAAVDALPDDATDEEKEEAGAAALEDFYAGRYKTREEVEEALAEKDTLIGKHATRLDVLERQLEEAAQQPQQAEARQLDLPAWEAWAAEQVEGGAGENGALAALQNGGYDGYGVYIKHWLSHEDERVRAEATIFNNEMIMQMADVRTAQRIADAQAQPTVGDMQMQAAAAIKGKRADFDDYQEQMREVVEGMDREEIRFLRELASQGVQGQVRALDLVYMEAKLRGSSSKGRAADVERGRRKASADRATLAATTSSAEATSTRTPPPAAEQAALERKRGIRARQNLEPLEE